LSGSGVVIDAHGWDIARRRARGTGLRFLGALVVSLAAFAVLASPPALGGTASIGVIGITYAAPLGEANRVTVTEVPNGLRLADAGAEVVAGEGCSSLDAHTALCTDEASPPENLEVRLRDLDDTLVLPRDRPSSRILVGFVYMGYGDDRVVGCRYQLWVDASRGADEVTLCPVGEAAVIEGGPGPDLPRGADSTFENLIGGEGNDVLVGGAGFDRLQGGPGRDVLLGQKGPDWLQGKAGPDVLRAGRGRDRVSGGPGNDTLRTWDGERDELDGDRGHDRAIWDGRDLVATVERFG
jgi:serralysin